MRRSVSMTSIGLVQGIGVSALLLAWLCVPVHGQAGEETGFSKDRSRHRVKFRPLRFEKKSQVKRLYRLKQKKGAQAAQPPGKVVSGRSRVEWRQGKSAEDVASEKTARIREKRMKLLRLTIHDLIGEARASMMYRLAEEYWEHAKYHRWRTMREHEGQMKRWHEDCLRKRKAGQSCPPTPRPNLIRSLTYQIQAITLYKRILQNFPRYARAPEITFTLGLHLMEMNARRKKLAVVYLQGLLKKWPQSRFVAETHMMLGDYYFHHNKVNEAIQQYRQAARVARRVFVRSSTPSSQKVTARGIHLRSLYYLAWCDYNVGDYQRSLRRFKRVIQLSIRYRKTRESLVILRDESLRDMLRAFARLDVAAEAYVYFRRIVGPQYAYQAIRRLAHLYSKQGHFRRAIATYRYLMTMRPGGSRAGNGAAVPLLQNEIVRIARKILPLPAVYQEVVRLTRYLEPDSRWARAWRNRTSVWKAAREGIEQTLLEISTSYHQAAQREKVHSKREHLYAQATRLYRQYLQYFPRTESAYELRFYLAELLYRKAIQLKGKRRRTPQAAVRYFAQAARHYEIVAGERRGQFRQQASFAEVLSYEHLANRTTGSTRCRVGAARVTRGARGKVIPRLPIQRGSWDARLLAAYQRYLSMVTGPRHKEERLQTFFKTGAILYCYRHYLKSMAVFSRMAREYPEHELSRRAAFMILYTYEDLEQWPNLEVNARLFLKDRILTRNRRFKQEMYGMLIRSAYRRIQLAYKRKELSPLQAAVQWLAYEREFGVRGAWYVQRGFSASPASDNALALAGVAFSQAKRILRAIQARQRLLQLYPKSPLYRDMLVALGEHYEQIADYQQAAHWYERYVFGHKDYMTLATTAQPRRTGRGMPRTKGQDKAGATGRKQSNALFKAAAYRRGLGQFDRALKLYQHFLARFPKDKDIPQMYLAMGQIYEETKLHRRALGVYQDYLQRFQGKAVTRYLRGALRLYQKHFDKVGVFTTHLNMSKNAVAQQARKKLQRLQKTDLSGPQILYVHQRIARIYRQEKKLSLMEQRYMQIDALGYQMFRLRMSAMAGASPAREAYAQAKFFLVERRLRDLSAVQFVGLLRRDKKILQRLLRGMRQLRGDYYEVAALQYPEWVLASIYRVGHLYHLLARKIAHAPIPAHLSERGKAMYRGYIERVVMQLEDKALETYNLVLQKSAALGLYNGWVKRCELARDAINRRQGRVNPHTIFSQRQTKYWLVEPDVLDVTLQSPPATMPRPLPRRTPPPRPASSPGRRIPPIPPALRRSSPVSPRGSWDF